MSEKKMTLAEKIMRTRRKRAMAEFMEIMRLHRERKLPRKGLKLYTRWEIIDRDLYVRIASVDPERGLAHRWGKPIKAA